MGIGGPGTLTSRLEEPVPGLVEGRREYGNRFGIEGRIGPDQTTMLAIRALLRQSGWPAPLDRSKDFICWLRWFNSLGRDGFRPFAAAVQ